MSRMMRLVYDHGDGTLTEQHDGAKIRLRAAVTDANGDASALLAELDADGDPLPWLDADARRGAFEAVRDLPLPAQKRARLRAHIRRTSYMSGNTSTVLVFGVTTYTYRAGVVLRSAPDTALRRDIMADNLRAWLASGIRLSFESLEARADWCKVIEDSELDNDDKAALLAEIAITPYNAV